MPDRLGPEHVGEQRAVVHERLAKLLGRGLAPLVGLVDLVGLAVLVERAGMLDGQVSDPLVELAGRISLLCDQLGDQRASALPTAWSGASMKRTWISSQAATYRTRDDGSSGRRSVGMAPFTVAELTFTGGAAVLLGHDPVVLRAKAGT
jgi:hypothetical protein